MRFFSSLKMKFIVSCFAANAKGDIPEEPDTNMSSQLARRSSDIGVESFIEQIEQVEEQIEIFSNLVVKLKETNEESKSVTKTSTVIAIRKQMEKDSNEVVKMAHDVKLKIEAINKDNLASRQNRGCGEGTAIDRLRTNMTVASTKRFRDLRIEFQIFRLKIDEEYHELVERRVLTVTGTRPDEEIIDRLIETGNSETIYQEAIQQEELEQVMNTLEEFEERHDTLKEIEKKLLELHQIYRDMEVLVEAQGDRIDDRYEYQVKRIMRHVHFVMDVEQTPESSPK